MLKVIFRLLACVLSAAVLPAAQSAASAGKGMDLAQMPLEDVRIEAPNVEGLFSHLAFACDIPVGLEIAQDEDPLRTRVFNKAVKHPSLSNFAHPVSLHLVVRTNNG